MLLIKVDVDTVTGLQRVPVLLDLFKEYGVRASFFVPMGPDNTGKHVFRITRGEFLSRYVKINPFRLLGLRNLLYGLLLPSPKIGLNNPHILQSIIKDGQELGLHGYDHYEWQINLGNMKPKDIRKSFNDGLKAYNEVIGGDPRCFAAPGWKVSYESLLVEDEYNFLYASDTRGYSPFYPYANSVIFKTLQIPTTLPTLDELFIRGLDIDQMVHYLKKAILAERLSVMTCHAEYEGSSFYPMLERLLKELKREKVLFISMEELAALVLKSELVPVSPILKRKVPGLEGQFSFQGKILSFLKDI